MNTHNETHVPHAPWQEANGRAGDAKMRACTHNAIGSTEARMPELFASERAHFCRKRGVGESRGRAAAAEASCLWGRHLFELAVHGRHLGCQSGRQAIHALGSLPYAHLGRYNMKWGAKKSKSKGEMGTISRQSVPSTCCGWWMHLVFLDHGGQGSQPQQHANLHAPCTPSVAEKRHQLGLRSHCAAYKSQHGCAQPHSASSTNWIRVVHVPR